MGPLRCEFYPGGEERHWEPEASGETGTTVTLMNHFSKTQHGYSSLLEPSGGAQLEVSTGETLEPSSVRARKFGEERDQGR